MISRPTLKRGRFLLPTILICSWFIADTAAAKPDKSKIEINGGDQLKLREGQRRVKYTTVQAGNELKFSLTGPAVFAIAVRQLFQDARGLRRSSERSPIIITRDGESRINATIDIEKIKTELAKNRLGVASGKWLRHMQVPEGLHHYTMRFRGAADAQFALRLRRVKALRESLRLPAEEIISEETPSTNTTLAQASANGDMASETQTSTPSVTKPANSSTSASNNSTNDTDLAVSSSTPGVDPSDPIVSTSAAGTIIAGTVASEGPTKSTAMVTQDTTATSAPIRLAVMDVVLGDTEIDKVIGESLSSVLAAEIKLRSGNSFTVMTRNELKSVLQQQAQAQMMGCNEADCAADIGKMASAQQIVTASIGKIGEGWLFTIQRVDTKSGQVLNRQSVNWRSEPSGLVELCRPYVARLFDGSKAETYKGTLEVLTPEEGAEVHLNDALIGETPLKIVPDLSIGAHHISITKSGFLPYRMDVVVNRNERTLLQAVLIDESSLQPWYKKWWVWTGAAAIIGGTATTIMLLRDNRTTLDVKVGLPQ